MLASVGNIKAAESNAPWGVEAVWAYNANYTLLPCFTIGLMKFRGADERGEQNDPRRNAFLVRDTHFN